MIMRLGVVLCVVLAGAAGWVNEWSAERILTVLPNLLIWILVILGACGLLTWAFTGKAPKI